MEEGGVWYLIVVTAIGTINETPSKAQAFVRALCVLSSHTKMWKLFFS